jgi:cytochrome P450 PksS
MRAPLVEFDPSRPAFKRDPYPAYRSLRDTAPVVRSSLKVPGVTNCEAYFVTRYDDVSALLKDRRFAKNPVSAGVNVRRVPEFLRPLTRNMLSLDDPDHSRLKRLVQAAFTPRRIALLEQQIAAISAGLLERLAGRTSFDLIADYAMPLPVAVISELLGVPVRDRQRFARWSGAFIRGATSRVAMLTALPNMVAFLRYMKRLIALKRADPADDLVTALIDAEVDHGRLDAEELMAMIAILLSAGHETTMNLIGHATLTLIEHKSAANLLRHDPNLIETGIEELLRFTSPVAMSTHRYALEPVVIDGTEIPAGALVFGLIASANRDERQFAAADQLDLARAPNRHLTFGEGGHYCIGAALARLEGKIAVSDILAYLPGLRLALPRDRLRWTAGLVLNGLEHLPVAA